MERPRKVGIPVDGSEDSKKALRWFLDNAADPSDTVIFIHVQELLDLPLFNLKSGLNIPTEQWMKAITERNLIDEELSNEVTSMCQEKKIYCEYISVTNKKPGEGIVSVVTEMNIQLIVMGSRGLSNLRRTILGSVSDYVLHHAQVPICIVPREYGLSSHSPAKKPPNE
ncbi:unnamed protein product [Hymenolepis diminuta]|uniref:Usp domain-containing protein n=1 Tax=Hymenolepis diminuta TaxID=6216 RepID=A0A0R3SQV3_HYMDI|nr:unnamed protein product [Hymenolepis diminuta]VUZ55260.1 unnamed protein product [Hymenolepis diminuta]